MRKLGARDDTSGITWKWYLTHWHTYLTPSLLSLLCNHSSYLLHWPIFIYLPFLLTPWGSSDLLHSTLLQPYLNLVTVLDFIVPSYLASSVSAGKPSSRTTHIFPTSALTELPTLEETTGYSSLAIHLMYSGWCGWVRLPPCLHIYLSSLLLLSLGHLT